MEDIQGPTNYPFTPLVFQLRRRYFRSFFPWLQGHNVAHFDFDIVFFATFTKGQIKPKPDWRAVDSPKKRTNKFVLFAFLLFTVNKTNSCFVFWEHLQSARTAFGLIWPLENSQVSSNRYIAPRPKNCLCTLKF